MVRLIKLSISAPLLVALTLSMSLASAEGERLPIVKYKNTKMGFELSYPKTWAISEDSETSVTLRKFLKDKNQVVFISFFLQKNINPKSLPVYSWYEEKLAVYKKNGTSLPSSINIINTGLGGKPAVLMKHNGKLGENNSYYWAFGTDILNMSFYPLEDIKNDIDKIISTLKIYESN